MYAHRTDNGVQLRLEGVEIRLLRDLVEMLGGVVREAAPAPADPDDPFAWWEAQSARQASVSRDPGVARLFPRASTDPEADRHLGEFSRIIVAQQRTDEAAVVTADLDARGRRGRIEIPRDHVDAWLRTLNAINLVLTARLGIVDEISAGDITRAVLDDDDDPRAFGFHVHQWIAGTMESILDVL